MTKAEDRRHWARGQNSEDKPAVKPQLASAPVAEATPATGAGAKAPCFTRGFGDGPRIGPHKLIWPAYWGTLKDSGNVEPIALEAIRRAIGKIITVRAIREPPLQPGDWPSLNEKDITEALNLLSKAVEGKPVYICGGKLYCLDDSGTLCEEEDHLAARPYLWPFAHNVRPAAQSLGVRRCEDCHATEAPFFFGKVAVDSPLESERDSVKKMVEFQGINAFYAWAFAFSFVFRPWLKVVTLGSCAILAAVLLLYGLKALACVAKVLVGKDE